ncbi:kinase-like domain-containing protein [Crepidotus variabilis]|uniref:Kinase-like domain-containing protein n=1 Tax=Crepidotus variabilis TaxID=179855 RepID=A0A9P6EAQ8_9AGAR|nr:kinase-like domain-containing protein [Crepidotus variabilis]
MPGCARQISDNVVVKETPTQFLELEVEALRFVKKNTTIPVPEIYDIKPSATEKDFSTLSMQYMEGEMVARKWRFLTPAQKRTFMKMIGSFVQQLRNLKQPSDAGFIGSIEGNACYDTRVCPSKTYGPFVDERAYNDWRISTFDEFGNIHEPTARQLQGIRKQMSDNHRIYFTHGDISVRNVLIKVHGDGDDDVEITALLDWEQAGWRPEFWEAAKIVYGMDPHGDWCHLAREEIFPGYENEIQLENELLLISGPPR